VKRRTIIPLAVAAILAAGSALLPSMVGLAYAQTQELGGTGIGGIGGSADGGDQLGGDNSVNIFTGNAGNGGTGGAAANNTGNGGSATLDRIGQMPIVP
jgi:hypothetical protein